MSVGIVFLGHGTRLAAGVLECLSFTHTAELKVRARISSLDFDLHFKTAFLELQPPALKEATAELVSRGCQSILICPLFLFEAGHMKDDIPQLIADTQADFPGVRLRLLAKSIGASAEVVRAATDHARSTHQTLQPVSLRPQLRAFNQPWDDVEGLLFVGRGSKDTEAYASFQSVAHRVASELQLTEAQYDCSFLAGLGKRFEVGLSTLQARGLKNITVLPYLLFRGLLTDALPGQVETWKQATDDRVEIKVTIVSHLAPHACVLEHVVRKVICGILERV